MYSSTNSFTTNPEKEASLISRLLFCFIHPLLRLGFRRPLELCDLSNVLPENEAGQLTASLKQHWKNELAAAKSASRPPKLLKAVYSMQKKRFWSIGILVFMEEILRALQPYLMGHVIRYFQSDSDVSLGVACSFAAALSTCAFIFVLCHHRYFYRMQTIGMQLRVACSGLIYSKLMTVDVGALREVTVGHVVNLISTDVSRFDQVVLFLHYFWASPVSLITVMCLLYLQMRSSSFAGFGVLFIMIPIQMSIGRMMGKYRRKVAQKSDKRIGVMNEILNAVRVIKMYAWEYPFMMLVKRARMKEVQKLRYHAFCQAVVIGSYYVTGRLALLGALAAHVLIGMPVTSEVVFVGAAMFNAARLTLSLYLPFAVQNFMELRVTLDRIQRFLMLPDKSHQSTFVSDKKQFGGSVNVKNVSASWDPSGKESISSVSFSVGPGQLLSIVGPLGSGKSTILQTILKELKPIKGELSVKGRLAYVPQEAWLFPGTIRQNVLFGSEMNQERYNRSLVVSSLKLDLMNLPKGDLTYVSDKGSTLSGGQKARINLARAVYQDADVYLFDDPLSAVDSTVGKSIFETCILGYLKEKARILVTHQIHHLKGADRILVMKQGCQIACSSYNELMAEEDKFLRILQETEISYKTKRSSATNQAPEESSTEERSEDFDIAAADGAGRSSKVPIVHFRPAGSPKRSPSTSPEARHLLESSEKNGITDTVLLTSGKPVDPADEYVGSKGVSCKTYWIYLRAIGHPFVVCLLFSMAILVQYYSTFCDLWLRQWSNEDEIHRMYLLNHTTQSMIEEKKSKLTFFLGYSSVEHLKIWSTMIVILLFVSVFQAILLRFSLLMAAFRLHSRMFKHIIRTSVVFFDQNPIGRILNRFSKDTNVMDELLAFVFFDFILGALILISYVLVNGILNPWMFLVLIPLICIFAYLRHYYMQTARPLKRLEATARSPLYSHFSSSVSGLAVIRAFKAEDKLSANFMHYLNTHSVVWSSFLAASRLFSVYVDCLSAVYLTLVAFVSILTAKGSQTDSGSVGLSLFYASSLMGFLQFMLRQSTEVENMVHWQFISFAFSVASASFFYYSLSSHALDSGSVGLSLFYAAGLSGALAYCLKQLTTTEESMVSVERIIEYGELPEEANLTSANPPPDDWPSQGEVKFENVSLRYNETSPYVLKDISFTIKPGEKIGLVGRTGAGKSSVITILFRLVEPKGRVIIDGIDTKTIGLHELRKKVSIIPQDPTLFLGTLRLNLDPFDEYTDEEIWSALEHVRLKSEVSQLKNGLNAPTDEGGHNFSIGQRQLLCLARALLRKNKILVLDEATANVDLNTDALIQQTIRSEFKHSSVLTIAHRLNTVMDCNRILVIQDGQLIEDDEPATLLASKTSLLTQFVLETGEENAELLKRMAARAKAERAAPPPQREEQNKKNQ